MRALLVVLLHPPIEIDLQFLQCPIDRLPKRDPIDFIQHGLAEALVDPVGQGMPRLGPRVVDVSHSQIPFVFMALGCAAVLGPAVGERAVQGNLLLLEEGPPIIQEIGGRDGYLPVIPLCEAHLAVGSRNVCW
jgi:hypothetical protein